jgi:hypothetical protein
MELPQLTSFEIGGNTITIPTNHILTEREAQQILWAYDDENERYLSYQARMNIKEAQMRESSDFTDTESEALDEFFAEMSVVKERSDAD